MKLRRWETILEIIVLEEDDDPWERWHMNPVAKQVEEWIDDGTIFNWYLRGNNRSVHGGYRLTLYIRKGKLTMDSAIKQLRAVIDAAKKEKAK